jgi:hypothetical protein
MTEETLGRNFMAGLDYAFDIVDCGGRQATLKDR